MGSRAFGGPVIDISGTYYGAFPPTSNFEDIVSPMSAKRPRDSVDEIISDTLGSLAIEAKKKRLDPSYNEGKAIGKKRGIVSESHRHSEGRIQICRGSTTDHI